MIKNGIGENITPTDSINEPSNIIDMTTRLDVTYPEIISYLI